MNNKSIKVIDDHNIDRNATVMFAIELAGSEYVVYSIERDTESNNVFVSRVLKDVDGTSNMLNIDEADKKEEISNIVKVLISTAVSNQNGKLTGAEMNLSDGKVIKFIGVSFNKEQKISVQKTYITTVKKDVTNVAEKYYDVIVPSSVQEILEPEVAPVEVFSTITPVDPEPVAVVSEPQIVPSVVSNPTPVEVIPELPSIPVVETPVVSAPAAVITPEPAVTPTPVVVSPESVIAAQPVVVETPQVVTPNVVAQPTPVIAQPAVAPVAPVVESVKVEPHAIQPTPVVPEPIPDAFSQPLVFNASKETNLNAALGEAAEATNIPVESIQPVKEFGVDEPVKPTVVQPASAVAPMVQPEVVQEVPKVLTKKAGFANSKFFMVVAVAFFLASCIFLGYEVFNYFQLIK